MIIFLTGPFGVGKSTVARLLVERVPGAILYDPEPVGALLRDLLGPVEQVSDFQEYGVWRALVVDLARRVAETYGRPLVIPMTVWRRDYFEAITGGLRQIDPALLCVRLTASREVLLGRILGRPDADGPHAWCLAHLEVGLAAAADPAFGVEVSTEGRTPTEIADAIVRELMPEDGRR
jgi:predicted kinase